MRKFKKTKYHCVLEKAAALPERQRLMLREIIKQADINRLAKHTLYNTEFVLLINDSELSAAARRVCQIMIKLDMTKKAADTIFANDYSDMVFNEQLQSVKNQLTVYLKPKNWSLIDIKGEVGQQWWEMKKWLDSQTYALAHISHGICEHSNKIVFGVQHFDKRSKAIDSAVVKEFSTVLDLINFLEK